MIFPTARETISLVQCNSSSKRMNVERREGAKREKADLLVFVQLWKDVLREDLPPIEKKFSLNLTLSGEIARELFGLRVECQLPRLHGASEMNDTNLLSKLVHRRQIRIECIRGDIVGERKMSREIRSIPIGEESIEKTLIAAIERRILFVGE